jgi:hypothetical protein
MLRKLEVIVEEKKGRLSSGKKAEAESCLYM